MKDTASRYCSDFGQAFNALLDAEKALGLRTPSLPPRERQRPGQIENNIDILDPLL